MTQKNLGISESYIPDVQVKQLLLLLLVRLIFIHFVLPAAYTIASH